MAFKKIEIHGNNFENVLKSVEKEFPKDYKKIKEFIKKKQIEDNISKKRSEKIVYCFKAFLKFIKKDFDTIIRKDLERFKLNKKYSKRSLRDYVEVVKKFYELHYPKKYGEWELNRWFKIPRENKTPEILKEAEVERLYKSCKSNQDRFIIAVLFDSGARIEEFLNIRFEDMIEPTENFPYYKIDLKEEYSKTEGRTIGLYWKLTTEAIRNYLNEINGDAKDQIIKKDYDAIRMFLGRLGKKILGKRVHPHIFRKSSATYYANLNLGREKLCIRYGWRFSSSMPDVYIKRAGITEDEIKDKILNNDLGKLEKQNKELKTKFDVYRDNSEEKIEQLRDKVSVILKALTSEKPVDIEIFDKTGKKVKGKIRSIIYQD